jgi:hypothetical protein
MQEEMIAEIEAAKPEFVVLVNVLTSWLPRPASDTHIIDWANHYAATAYYRVGLIDILPGDQTEYKWDAEAAGVKPRSESHLFVLRRKVH